MTVIQNNRFIRGYTLVEMAVVLAIIAVVAGTGITIGMQQIEFAKISQTNKKMEVIQEAIMAFRTQNDRIPCPADGTLLKSDANYGVEAANPAYCRDGTPAANFNNGDGGYLVSGVVPIAALGLPDEFMYDGWGNKFTYTVNRSLTWEGSFSLTPASENCGGLTITDPTGTVNRTTGAAYALISHGKNGHGAYTRTGTRKNTGETSLQSVNTHELQNCDCDSTVAATGLNGIYVQKEITEDGTNPLNNFDDIVAYKERWQMRTESEPTPEAYDGAVAALPDGNNTPKFKLFTRQCDTFTQVASPAVMPAFSVSSATLSPDKTYLLVGGDAAPWVSIYKRTTGTTYVATGSISPAPGAGWAYGNFTFTKDGKYVYMNRGNWIGEIYKRTGDTFTKIFTPPATHEAKASWSDDGSLIALSDDTGGSNPPAVYRRSGDNFYQLPALSPALPVIASPGHYSAFLSPDGNYLAVAQNGSLSATYLYFYKRNQSTDTFERVVGQPAVQPTFFPILAFWDKSSRYLYAFVIGRPLSIYRRDGDTLTLLSMPPDVAGFLNIGLFGSYIDGMFGRITLFPQPPSLFRIMGERIIILPPSPGTGSPVPIE